MQIAVFTLEVTRINMEKWLYRWLPIIFGCHCMDERSFHFHGKKFPVCARCTGELVGMIISLLSCFFYRPSVLINILLLIPMIADGTVQLKTSYISNNRRRFITGLLFGYAILMLYIISLIATFNLGLRLGQQHI